MTRIAFFTGIDTRQDAGGVATSAERLVSGLLGRGYEVDHVDLTRSEESLQRTIRMRPVEGDRPGAPRWSIGPLSRSSRSSKSAARLRDVADCFEAWVEERRPALTIGFYLYPAGFVCAWVQERLGVPALVCGRGTDVGRDLLFGRKSSAIAFALARAAQAVFVSRRLLGVAATLVRFRREPRVVYNSIPPPANAVVARHERKAGEVTYCGMIREKKGVDLLLDAVGDDRWLERRLVLHLVGDFQPAGYEEELASAYPQLSDPARVKRTVWQAPESAAEIIARAPVVVVPSVDDGCPNVMLECFAAGTPVVSSSVLSEFYPDGSEALLFRSRDASDLAARVVGLSDRPELWQRSSELVRAWCPERFSVERELGEFRAVIEGLLHDGKSAL